MTLFIVIFCLSLLISGIIALVIITPDRDDHNYQTVQKLFFAVNPEKIPAAFQLKTINVYGVMIETKTDQNEDVIFAAFITGFTGYYTKSNGGVIAGRKYSPNNNEVQRDLMEMCDNNDLTGRFQTRESRIAAAKLVMEVKDHLNFTTPFAGTYSISPDSSGMWFLTEKGFRCAEIKNSIIAETQWYRLIQKSLKIINDLKVTASGNEDYELRNMRQNFNSSPSQNNLL